MTTTTTVESIPTTAELKEMGKGELMALCRTYGVYIPMGAGHSTLVTVLSRARDKQPIFGNGTTPKAQPASQPTPAPAPVNRIANLVPPPAPVGPTLVTANGAGVKDPAGDTVTNGTTNGTTATPATDTTVFPSGSNKTGTDGAQGRMMYHLQQAVKEAGQITSPDLKQVQSVLEEIGSLADALMGMVMARKAEHRSNGPSAPVEVVAPKPEPGVAGRDGVVTEVQAAIAASTLGALRRAIKLAGLKGIDMSGSKAMKSALNEWLTKNAG